MARMCSLIASAAVVLLTLNARGDENGEWFVRARALLMEVPLVDGHNDLPWQLRKRAGGKTRGAIDLNKDQRGLSPALHSDAARLRSGGLGAQFWSVYIPVELEGGDRRADGGGTDRCG